MAQSKFNMNPKVNSPHADVTGAALGAVAGGAWNSKDVGKAVKLVALDCYGAVDEDDDFEGFITAMEPFTVNEGFPFGSVQRNKRVLAVLGEATAPAVFGSPIVCADYVAAVGADDGGKPRVKVGAGTLFHWRVISIVKGDGTAVGDELVIERVNG